MFGYLVEYILFILFFIYSNIRKQLCEIDDSKAPPLQEKKSLQILTRLSKDSVPQLAQLYFIRINQSEDLLFFFFRHCG